jgi:hypothetical protein
MREAFAAGPAPPERRGERCAGKLIRGEHGGAGRHVTSALLRRQDSSKDSRAGGDMVGVRG